MVSKVIELYSKNDLLCSWWDTDQPTNLLYAMNEIRTPWIVNTISEEGLTDKKNINFKNPLRGLSILDVGCGGGYLAEEFAKLGASVTGIDPSKEAIESAKEHLAKIPGNLNISYSCEFTDEHSENNSEKYDVIVALEMIHYVENLDLFIKMCLNCLKPGGLIYITSINKTWSSWLLVMFLHYVKGVPYDFIKWDTYSVPEAIIQLLEKYNCKVKSVGGWRYNVLGNKWNWCHYFPNSFALHAVKQ